MPHHSFAPTRRQIGLRLQSIARHCRFGRAVQIVFVTAAGVLCVPVAAQAQQTFTGAVNDDWDTTTGNWTPDLTFTNGDDAIFDATADGRTITVDAGGIRATNLTFSTGIVTIDGGNLDVDGTITTGGTAAVTIAAPILEGVTVGGGGTLQFGGGVGGTVTFEDGVFASLQTGTIGGSVSMGSSGQLSIGFGISIDGGLTVSSGLTVINGSTSIDNDDTGDNTTVSGTGTLTVNAATDLGAGTLMVTGGGYSQNALVTGNVTTSGGTSTLSSNIDGDLLVSGGTTTIAAASEVSGSVTVTGGTFQTSGGGQLTASNGITVNGGTYVASGVTIADVDLLSGTVRVSNNLQGDLTVSAGATGDMNGGLNGNVVTSGTFTSSGSVVGSVTQNGGTTTIDALSVFHDGYAITGGTGFVADTLQFVTSGAGVDVTGGTLTVQNGGDIQGDVDIGVGTATGGSFVVESGGTVTGNVDLDRGSASIAGTVTGTLEVAAGRTATVSGTVGAVDLDGLLELAGTVTGTLTVDGTLDASDGATVDGLVTNNGLVTVADGDVLSFGSYVASSGSTTQFGLSETTSGRIDADTTADIQSGAAIVLDVTGGATLTDGQTYTVLASGSGVTMNGDISDTSSLFDFTSQVVGNDLVVTAEAAIDLETTVGDDDNLAALGAALDAMIDANEGVDISTALGAISDDEALIAALEDLGPDDDFGTVLLSFGFSQQVVDVLQSRFGGPALDDTLVSRNLASYEVGDQGGTVVPWLQLDGRQQSLDATVAFGGYDASIYAGTFGLEMQQGGSASYGIALSYGLVSSSGSGASDNLTSAADMMGLSAYASGSVGDGGQILGVVSYLRGDFEDERAIPLLSETASSQYQTATYGASVTYERALPLGGVTLTPSFSMAAYRFERDAYTETGSSGNLSFAAVSSDSVTGSLGVEISPGAPSGGGAIVPSLSFGVTHEFADRRFDMAGAFEAGGPAFVYSSRALDRTSGMVGLGMTARSDEGLAFSSRLAYRVRGDQTDTSLGLNLRVEF